MVVKKATVKKTPVKSSATTAKKTSVKASAKPTVKKKVSKGQSLICEVCGLSVVVEQVGDLVFSHADVLLCCRKPMKQKVRKAKVAAKK
ncbi:MAG: hypothetical protein Q7J73_05540, partial [Dehalococcoidales bacterium]|nr:hypothetical protein [Dehalococcoidales bacterium]